MTLVPGSATIRVGQVVVLRAIDGNGGPLAGMGINWSSTDDAVATVSTAGEVLGRGVGQAIITASALGRSQSSTIQVLARKAEPDSDPGKPGLKPDK
jgi:hypothetical protein